MAYLISWNTKTDELDHGAWIKGRIYEDKCDISPDGKLFLYFVLKGQYNELGLPNTWTALSRPPWLKALEEMDAVFVETTSHIRVCCMMHALAAGCDVYGEKPLTLTIAEGRNAWEPGRLAGTSVACDTL